MRDILPDFVVDSIRDRFLAGIADAEANYEYGEPNEDALTGALGQAISTKQPMTSIVNGQSYHWKIYYRRIRSQGTGAPEKALGADGIFQIEALDPNGKILRRKGLPFQAKKNWDHKDSKLIEQCESMIKTAGDGIVIDYTPNGYKACRAETAIAGEGRRSSSEKIAAIQPLGQALGNHFLECEIGVRGLFYDPHNENFAFDQATSPAAPALHLITTSIQKVDNPPS